MQGGLTKLFQNLKEYERCRRICAPLNPAPDELRVATKAAEGLPTPAGGIVAVRPSRSSTMVTDFYFPSRHPRLCDPPEGCEEGEEVVRRRTLSDAEQRDNRTAVAVVATVTIQ